MSDEKPMGQVIQIDEARIRDHLGEMVRGTGLNAKTRRDLGLRLPWLFENGRLPVELAELARCVREDGNDGAHQGTLTEPDAADLLDFTMAFLQRVYTEPKRIELAARRATRQGMIVSPTASCRGQPADASNLP
jgi:hypothetical protein